MPSSVLVLAAWAALTLLACDADKGTNPKETDPLELAWLQDLIRSIETAPVTNPPTVIYEYRYRKQTVYYVPPRCCDIPSDLYDREGRRLCHPDGGFTGKGDGLCPDFFDTRSDERVIWSDPRTTARRRLPPGRPGPRD